ncbi:MAG TPA: DUF4265 domain-containing protein [Fimbriimonadaceae bacterium]|nr:DUF4265 domain-containing protein [Fimbriimonadaceae bacterium]
MSEFVMHDDAVWHKLPHFVLHYPVPEIEDAYEQLVTENLGHNRFRLLCIPFFIYDLSLGDVIEGDPSVHRGKRQWRIVERSGRRVYRVAFSSKDRRLIKSCITAIKQMGGLVEKAASGTLYAIDAADDEIAEKIVRYLIEGESNGQWEWEAGQSA